MARPKVIGITGSIGTGKSLVGNLLKKRGYTVIDTDEVVHNLFENSEELRQAIENRFGNAVISGAKVDRVKLGELVFNDTNARKDLEHIVHPAVLKACDITVSSLPADKPVFVLVPLLFEARVEARYDEIWTVIANEQTLYERIRKRNGLTDEQIAKRIAAQLPQNEKIRRSHRVIDNSGSIEETEQKVDETLLQLLTG